MARCMATKVAFKNIQPVNLLRCRCSNTIAHSLCANQIVQSFPLFFTELFAVVEAGQFRVRRQNNRCGVNIFPPAGRGPPSSTPQSSGTFKLLSYSNKSIYDSFGGFSSEIRPSFPPRNSSSTAIAALDVDFPTAGNKHPALFSPTAQSSS